MREVRVLHWFRQDLRSDVLAGRIPGDARCIGLYILDSESCSSYPEGAASGWWLHHSLAALMGCVPLILRRGAVLDELARALDETEAQELTFTRSYGPGAGALETAVKALCDSRGVICRRFGGYLLHEPEAIRTGQGGIFKVYTPFMRACMAAPEPRTGARDASAPGWTETSHGTNARTTLESWHLYRAKPDWAAGFVQVWQPGEAGAKARLARFIETGLQGYRDRRNRADLAFISGLSPHLHRGEISPAAVWAAVRSVMDHAGGRLDGDGQKFLHELLWRDFSAHLLFWTPTLVTQPLRPEFGQMPWRNSPEEERAWQRGLTGYPFVDAGMRELWHTGFMHNRVRMVAASFLTKHLMLPWTRGEAWFRDTLVDADLASNAASWQWVAGCGTDASPWFRIFNPILQGEKFDPDGAYVKQWIPELRNVPVKFVHRPWEAPADLLGGVAGQYPAPIVSHAAARARALAAFAGMRD